MRKRELIALLGSVAAWPFAARGQRSGRLPVVGCVWSPVDAESAATRQLSLLKGLAEFRIRAWKNLNIEGALRQ